MSGPPRLRLRVSPAAELAVRRGHPWVYADRIRDQNREGTTGELAILYDRRDRFLAVGLFDPLSPLRIRVLHVGEPVTIDGDWWRHRLETALGRRAGVFGSDTSGWRWIHGESDGWPGLVLDRYADVLVLKLYTTAWLPRLPEIIAMFQDRLQPRSIVLRLSRNIAESASRDFQRSDGDVLQGDALPAPVVFQEHGLRFEAEVVRGQKTGFYLDQRDNRVLVGSFARDQQVLNAFSFSGGFSLHAARGGARGVTDLDMSPHALASARRNFALNSDDPAIAAVEHRSVQADVFEWLSQSPDRKFGVVVLDPPSLARRESERAGALAAYARLAGLGAQRLVREGILVACSCSAHVSGDEFHGAVRDSLRRLGYGFEEIRTTGHPVDHPPGFAEAHYLKAIYLRIKGPTGALPRSSARG